MIALLIKVKELSADLLLLEKLNVNFDLEQMLFFRLKTTGQKEFFQSQKNIIDARCNININSFRKCVSL